jgi:ketosteroid isomerase-like protein
MRFQEKFLVIEKYLSAYNAFDVDGMMALLHDEVEFRNISDGQVNAMASGRDAFRKLAESSRELFSTRKQTPVSISEDGERMMVEIQYHGTLAVDLPNGMQQGQTLELEGRSEFSFRDGLIAEIIDIS